MLNDCELPWHQNWISAISASFDTVFDPCQQHAGHVRIPQLMETVLTGKGGETLAPQPWDRLSKIPRRVKSGAHSKWVEMCPF